MTPKPPGDHEEVFVEAAARLHFGVLDLRGSLGRRFGGIGAAAPAPTLLVSARRAETLEATGEDRARTVEFAARFLAHHGVRGGARIAVHRTLPPHCGLGSGTQLALAVARALAEIYGIDADAPALARAVGRAQRSAIGTWTFAGGGLVLEGGRFPSGGRVAPLLARLPFPPTWRCVVALPASGAGMSGAAEAEAFARLPPPPERDVERVAHLVLMALLPALADADLPRFGPALTEIQSITGGWFAPVQGGTFTPGASGALIQRMSDWGAAGVGQSSWGPAVYGIVEGDESAVRLTARVRDELGASGTVYEGAFRTDGARVWRTAVHAAAR
jgi:beta-ribofuranosylaminobenzene 5'-phosphate synthase